MQEKIIKNKVKDTKTLTLQAFLDDFTFNTLKDANKRDVTKLKNAMRKRGWTSPVFTWQKFVVDGTGRRKAVVELLEEGYTFPEGIPYVEVEAKDMAEAKQLALDFSSQHGYITKDSFLEYTADFEVDFETMQIAGFDKDKFIDTNENDDDVPDVATEGTPLTSAGDIYELGAHRVLCGDSTDSEAVARLMDGKKANLSFSSPPYNAGALEIDGNESTQKKYQSYDDNKTEDEYFQFLFDFLSTAMMFSDEQFVNIGLVEKNKRVIIRLNHAFVDKFKDIIYWKKSTVAPHIQKGVINNLVEFILCFGDGKRKFLNPQFGQGTYWNVIEGKNASGNEVASVHKATFPVYLPENILTNFTSRNGIVLESFLGSGSTLIAAEKTGRICYGMELDPKYVDVIISRYVEFTGNNKIKKNGIDIIWEIKK